MERDKRQARGPWDGSEGPKCGEWATCCAALYVAQRTACTAYPVTRPSSHYCVRCTYATYETTSCVSGLVAKSQALVYSLPWGALGGKEGTGYPGGGSIAVHVERTASEGRVRASHVETDQSPRAICCFACSVRTFFQHGRAEWIRHGHGL